MPFEEIKPPKDFIRVHDKGITISTSFIHFFIKNNEQLRVRIFSDEENRLVGLQPSKEGYKLSPHGGGYIITCMSLSNKLEKKEYFPKWSKEHKMLIFSF
jgi:hypothetical protein